MQKIINTKKVRALFTLVPENKEFDNSMWIKYFKESEYEDIPEGNWQILGLLHKLSEQQKFDICCFFADGFNVYPDYSFKANRLKAVNFLSSAHESFASLLQANGIYHENPYGKKPERMIPFKAAWQYTKSDHERIDQFNMDMDLWQVAQKQVGNWLVLIETK
jgi:hypothetical protein